MSTTFGSYLRSLRKSRGLSTKKLSELSGVSQSYISHIEIGRKKNLPSPEILKKLAEPLGTTYAELAIRSGYSEFILQNLDSLELESIGNGLKIIQKTLMKDGELLPQIKEFLNRKLAERGVTKVTADNYIDELTSAYNELKKYEPGSLEFQICFADHEDLKVVLDKLMAVALDERRLSGILNPSFFDIADQDEIYFKGFRLSQRDKRAVESLLIALWEK